MAPSARTYLPRRNRRRGFAVIATGLSLTALCGLVGLSVDLGRAYIARNEAQAYVDSAALAAALELDGTTAGISRANSSIAANTNKWQLGTSTFASPQTDYATSSGGPWEASPNPAAGYRFARVRTTVQLPLYFVRVLLPSGTSTVAASAVAGQLPKTRFTEGVFPFSPFAHDTADPTGNAGLVPGTHYTLRWPSTMNSHPQICPGDDTPQMLAMKDAAGNAVRGYIDSNSASDIRSAIESDDQTNRTYELGEPLLMSSGQKSTEYDALVARINQDSDTTSTTYAQYMAGGDGNGRRLVFVPINDGAPNFRVVAFEMFFVLPAAEYDNQPHTSFCGEYVGAGVVGSGNKGAGGPGIYVVRLVQ